MRIETDRLLLEELSLRDLEEVHRLHSIPEVDQFNTLGIPRDLEESRAHVQEEVEAAAAEPRKKFTWCIRLKAIGDTVSVKGPQDNGIPAEGGGTEPGSPHRPTRPIIGLAGYVLSRDKYRLGEIWYKLDPDFWGLGYATEVARALVLKGFIDFGLHKVEAGVAVGNLRSVRVLEKCNMVREGRRRRVLPIRGRWVDNFHYAIVEDDPRDY